MKGLQELVTEMDFMKISEEHDFVFSIPDGKKGGIWISGAGRSWIFKGVPPFNHNLEYGEILLSEN